MMPQPLSHSPENGTERLIVRLMERRDIEDLRRMHNDDATLFRLTDVTHVSEAQQEAWFQSVSTSRSSKRYVARRRDDDAFIGMFRIDQIDMVNRNCMVGCDVAAAMRGQGYATETYLYLLDYLFDQMGLHRAALVTLHDNDQALSLYLKLGFAEEGRQREAIFRNGTYHDLIAMGLLADDWRQVRGKLAQKK